MKTLDPIWFSVLSEFSINLAVAWFGAAFILPVFSNIPSSFNLSVLTVNILFGILSLFVAYYLRKVKK